jgi:hypothetical protein
MAKGESIDEKPILSQNLIVRKAIEALHSGDQKAWSALFETNGEMYDGNPLAVSRNSPETRLATNDSPRSIASRMMDWM